MRKGKYLNEEGKTKGRKITYNLLICLFGGIFLVSALYLAGYYMESSRQSSEYNELAGMLESLKATLSETVDGNTQATQNPTDTTEEASEPTQETEETLPTEDVTESTEPTEFVDPNILPEYRSFYLMNSDMVGWITVPDTKINYPVMQTPDNPDYYLKRNFYKKSSDWGAIYVREVCNVNTPSDNLTLYGHHMKDGSMFAGLDKFKEKSFWETHRTFSFDTLYERRTYEIIGVFKTSANIGQGFSYHLFVDAENEEQFNEFVSTVKSLAFYETGVTAQYGDKLITLSTCEYTLNNGRFVVVAKQIS